MPYKDKEKQKEAVRRAEEKRKEKNGDRHRAWTLICYPDSMPEDWAEQISQLHLAVWVSPLHDQDTWTEADERNDPKHKAGTLKKPHYHLVVQYPDTAKQNREQFLQDFGFLNGPASVKAVKSLSSMVRYLVHMDDPDKAQYKREAVRVFGGADPGIMDELGTAERHEALRSMRRFIREHEIMDFCDFVDYCDDCEIRWAHLLDDNSSYIIEKYIKSRRYKLMEAIREADRKHFGQ